MIIRFWISVDSLKRPPTLLTIPSSFNSSSMSLSLGKMWFENRRQLGDGRLQVVVDDAVTEPAARHLRLETVAVPEVVVDALLLTLPPRPRRRGHRQPQPAGEPLQKSFDDRGLTGPARPRQDDERSAFHRRSLHVLDQLADLLQGAFHLDHVLGDRDVAGLGADGVGLAEH